MRRSGITLTDLLVIIFVVVGVTAITISAQATLTEREERVLCQKNLSIWGKGLLLYSNENKGAFPRTVYDNSGKVAAFTQPTKDAGDADVDPYGNKVRPAANDITAALWRLLVTQDMKPEYFVCPATDDEIDLPNVAARDRMNFSTPYHLSYSYVNVYPTSDAIGKGYKTFITGFRADFAIASDLNPGVAALPKLTPATPLAEMRKANSLNHWGAGQNVLYADGHVEFQATPFAGTPRKAGGPRDNIFTFGETTDQGSGTGVSGSPVDAQDSVLLPTAADRPATRPPTSRPARVAAIASANEAAKVAESQPLHGQTLRSLLGRKFASPGGDYLQFVSGPGDVDVRIGQQTYAGRYSPATAGRLRVVLTIKGDSVVHYFKATLAESGTSIEGLTDDKGVVYKAAEPPVSR